MMKNIWQGESIRLRAANAGDGSLFADSKGNTDTDCMRRYDYIDFPLSDTEFGKRIEKYLSEDGSEQNFMFVIENTAGDSVGFIITFDCDIRMGTFKYGLFLLDKYKARGYGSEAVKIMLNYYFNELRYNKVNVYIYDYNSPSIAFHKKLGFREEGQLRQMAYSAGEYHDIYFYGMLRSEFNQANPIPEL